MARRPLIQELGMAVVNTVVINNPLGIHARPAALVVKAASRFKADIFFSKGEVRKVNGKSIMSVMLLAAEHQSEVMVEAEGEDAEAAVETLSQLLQSNFEDKI
jgi:phosphocarrier protein